MNGTYQKESYRLYHAWLLLVFAVLAAYSLYPQRLLSFSSMETMILLLFLLLDLLFAVMYVAQSVYWMERVTYEDASRASAYERRRYAGLHFSLFFAALAVYFCYCLRTNDRPSSPVNDSIAAGAVFAVAAVAAGKIRLIRKKTD